MKINSCFCFFTVAKFPRSTCQPSSAIHETRQTFYVYFSNFQRVNNWNLYVQIYDNNDKTGRDLQVNVSISLEKKTVGDSWERLKSSVQRQPKIHYNLQWNRKKKIQRWREIRATTHAQLNNSRRDAKVDSSKRQR